jgi:hypothetical protein
MGARSAVPKGSSAKVSRGSRRRARSVFTRQSARTAVNKLRRINRDRAKSGKPPLTSHKAPDGTTAFLTGSKYHA